MTEQKTKNPPPGPAGFVSAILTPHLEGVPEFAIPFEQTAAKLQSEFLTLWSHRAQAWINWPEQMSRCTTMADLAQAQGEFLTAMQKDYATYCDCVFRDTLIEQDDLGEPEEVTPKQEAALLHKQAA